MMHFFGLFEAMNQRIYDNYLILNRKNEQNKQIVIISIDSNTLTKIGPWPIKRKYYTEILNILKKEHPAVITFAIYFYEKKDEKIDHQLYKALKSFQNVILSYRIQTIIDKGIPVYHPTRDLLFPDIIHAHDYIAYSENSVIREFPLQFLKPALSIMTYKLFVETNPKLKENLHPVLLKWFEEIDNGTFNNQHLYEKILIDYKRFPSDFQQISLKNVLKGNYKKGLFTNKIVLIGLSEPSLVTSYPTPFTGEKINPKEEKNLVPTSSSVMLQAQIIDSLMGFRNLQKMPEMPVIYISIFCILGLYLISYRKNIVWQGAILFLSLCVLITYDYWLFTYFALWFPPSFAISLLVIVFSLSMYFTSTKVDSQLLVAINKLSTQKDLPLVQIPEEMDSKVDTLSHLVEVISSDRKAIKAIINGVRNGIIVIDNKGKILWANDTVKSVFNKDSVIETYIQDDIEEFDINEVVEIIKEKKFFRREIMLNDKDYLLIINPISEDAKDFVAIFNDITELKELDRLKTDMVRMVSHELKNPLMAIQIHTDNIDFIEEKPPEIELFNKEITVAAKLMLDTINDFLNLNKLESNLVDIQFEEHKISDMLKFCINLQKPIAQKRNIEIEFDATNQQKVLADKKQIVIVINNLVSNAIKYSKDDSIVNVSTERQNGFMKISVQDHGIGMAPDEVDKVFNKFYRCRNNKKGKIKGTGLGLAISQKIVKIHGGDIWVTSKENEGSCFSFTLQVAEES